MILTSLIAYSIDALYGEPKKIKHPVSLMGNFINLFNKYFYKNSITRGALLVSSLLITVLIITYTLNYLCSLLPYHIELLIISFIASTGIASNMLHKSVKEIIECTNPKEKLSFLVSRNTDNMTKNQIYKSSIETYSENINDGIIAPLLYLLCGGIYALFIYKAISTLDSMIGYKTKQFIKFGKIAAKLDDILNFIPARITGTIICLIKLDLNAFKNMIKQAKLCESPNAGYPMSAMANCLNVIVGGKTYYNNIPIYKPILGKGKYNISKNDVYNALKFTKYLDTLIIGGLALTWIITLI